ncbi:MAG: intradiol ring-cleavage dioxygenase [Chitinophagaceae bacterium]|nr:intradiol ring-cleavage dioxygenase [Chitinophagaceae bacterium]
MGTKICLTLLGIFNLLLVSCHGQTKPAKENPSPQNGIVGGPFENGEFMYIGMPENIHSTDTSAGWEQNGQKLLITGTIYKPDGKTPAPGVILYYYHTDIHGVYAGKQGLDPRVVRHGYIRGWVKSDANGKYAIYTIRPAPYPGRNIEAHIHPAIKEPNIDKEYYIDEFVFDDDKLLTSEKRKRMENRGGSGVLRVLKQGDLQIAEHNIVLGLNIPNYPVSAKTTMNSGLQIGEDQPSFMPFHAYGPDKGSRACPVCKYGRYHGIVYFVGNKPNWGDIKKWLAFLEQQSVARSKYLKTYFVYGNDDQYSQEKRRAELEKIGAELKLKNMALTFVPSFSDSESEANLNKINKDAENTFVIFRNSSIIDKFINLNPTADNFNMIARVLDTKKGDYFGLD